MHLVLSIEKNLRNYYRKLEKYKMLQNWNKNTYVFISDTVSYNIKILHLKNWRSFLFLENNRNIQNYNILASL